jgi:hypothetical protein
MPLEIHVNIRTLLVLALCAATHSAFGAPPEFSDSPTKLRPVTVEAPKTAPAVRFDIRSACPGIDAELQKTLVSAWGSVQKTGTFPVQLRVEGDRVTLVRSSVASMAYRPYLRAAFAKLDCITTSGEAQDFRFLLAIQDPEDHATTPRIALIHDK